MTLLYRCPGSKHVVKSYSSQLNLINGTVRLDSVDHECPLTFLYSGLGLPSMVYITL